MKTIDMSGFTDRNNFPEDFKEPWPGWFDQGKGYEDCCQTMLTAGLGAIVCNPTWDRERIIKAIVAAARPKGGATAMQVSTVMAHLQTILEYGYDRWVDMYDGTRTTMEIEDEQRAKCLRRLRRGD